MQAALMRKIERQTIHEFRFKPLHKKQLRGARAVEFVTGINAGTLNNSVNSSCPHKLGRVDAVVIQRATGDHRMHLMDARFLGRISIIKGVFDSASDMEILDCFAKLIKEVGEHANEVRESLAVGRFTRQEYEATLREWEDVVQAGYELQHRLETIIDEQVAA